MELFSCPACEGRLFFPNHACGCGAEVAFDPDARRFLSLAEAVPCANRTVIDCNWRADAGGELCRACATTRTHPDLTVEEHPTLWAEAEAAKRRVMAGMMRWGIFGASDPNPAPVFEMLSEQTRSGQEDVTMGHADGVITIDVAEADHAEREARKADLDERYRTMTGHFRHELGHFIFMRLQERNGFIGDFRMLFGDEREDYGAALERHYENGPPPGWQETHITAYATMHAHEDWAETFAHYLHLVDLVDSAAAADLTAPLLANAGPGFDAYAANGPEPLLTIAAELGVAVNHVNRSMGLADIYPFVLTPATREKIGFVQRWIREAAR